jgi:PAP2 superfamily
MSEVSSSNVGEAPKPKGVFHAIGKSSKLFVSFAATSVLVYSKSWIPLYYVCGALANGILCKTIKQAVREARPPQSRKKGYGMPSTHAQSFFYFLTVLTLTREKTFAMLPYTWLGTAICSLLFVYSLVASYWRVAIGIHTLAQTVVGGLLGTSMAALFFSKETTWLHQLAAMFRPFGDVTEGVPVPAKAIVLFIAALGVMAKEINAILKFLKKKNKQT